MANICTNSLYAYSTDIENINHIEKFFKEEYKADTIERDKENISVDFSSKWIFPSKEMKKLVTDLPNKDNVFIRCLSVEYGMLYHALWVYDGKEWELV